MSNREFPNMLVTRMNNHDKEVFGVACAEEGKSMSQVVRGLIACWLEVRGENVYVGDAEPTEEAQESSGGT